MQRPAEIWSEGCRLSADLWLPDEAPADAKHPAILLCHGWGGPKGHLNETYAPFFAKAGFAVLAFDYRGWGQSEGRLVAVGERPPADESGEITVRAREAREIVDPFDQIRDIYNCLDWLCGEASVDPDRVGLWGTSYGGGHVVYMAAHDARVKAIVSQVGAQQPDLIASETARTRALARVRGEISDIPAAEDAVPGLGGVPDLARMEKYSPIATAHYVRVPTLIIDAEEEELFDRMRNGHAVYEIVRRHTSARYEVLPCKHYEIYDKYYRQASTLARDWFVTHLK